MKLIPPKNEHVGKNHIRNNMSHILTRDPYADWAFILSLASVLSVILVGVGVISFIDSDLSRASMNAPEAKGTVSVLSNNGKLKNILKEFDHRAQKTREIMRGYSGSSDPSIQEAYLGRQAEFLALFHERICRERARYLVPGC